MRRARRLTLVSTLPLRGRSWFAAPAPLRPTGIRSLPIHTLALVWSFAIGACHIAHAPAQGGPSFSGSVPPPEVEVASKEITAPFLRAQVTQISADAFAGRGPATDGDRAARAYLVEQLTSLGLEPGRGRDGWEQPIDLVSVTTTMPKIWTFEHGNSRLSLSWWDQYIAGSGVQTARGTVDRAEVVFVGYGIEAPEYGWDDFKGRDVAGNVLLMLNNDPDWDPALFGGTTRLYYGRWTYKFESAARHGAAGAIIIHTTPSAGYPFQVVRASWGGTRFELPSKGAPALTVQGWVTEDGARALVQLAGRNLVELVQSARSKAFVPVALGITTSLRFENKLERAPTANVYGIIKGSDPDFADQYVIVSAHHDHLGVGKPDPSGDTVYNGAVDNAVGDAQVLGIARAFQALPSPPRRSILVLFTAAEEQGLLGSRYFAEHLPVAPTKIVADLNYDCGNIWGKTRDVTQVGRGKSSIDAVVTRVAGWQGRIVKPDQFPDRGSFYRSDQFSFAKIGVPALYLKTGTDFIGRPEGWGTEQILRYESHDYHQPSDEIRPDWNFDGMVEDAQIGFFAALEIANADQAPRWVPGDEFDAARKASLAGVR
jgi:Zn-dependent M28 family amino/carboxypeptidase